MFRLLYRPSSGYTLSYYKANYTVYNDGRYGPKHVVVKKSHVETFLSNITIKSCVSLQFKCTCDPINATEMSHQKAQKL